MDKSFHSVILKRIKDQMLELLEGDFIGLEGISLALWIINNDEYEMKSIDKLHYTFPAGLSHDKWQKLNVENDAAKGFESFVSCEFVVHQKAWGHVLIWKSKQWKTIIQQFLGALRNPQSVMSLVTTDQALDCCRSHLARKSGEAKLSCCVRLQDTSMRILTSAATFAGIWSNFRCTRESSAYVLSRVLTAPAQHICQFHLALRQSRRYWVLRLDYETPLAY